MRYVNRGLAGALIIAFVLLGILAANSTITATVNVSLPSANVSISSFSTTSSVVQGSQITFYANLVNTGELASGSMAVNLSISGPSNVLFSEDVSALAPGQNETVGITLNNATSVAGSYTASLSANYVSAGNVVSTGVYRTTYTVTSYSSGTGGGGPSGPVGGGGVSGGSAGFATVSAIPQLEISSVPLIYELVSGSEEVSSLILHNKQSFDEAISLSVPSAFSDLIKLPYKNVTLSPNQTLSLSVLYTAPQNISAGTYIVPLNITTLANGVRTVWTEYLSSSITPNVTTEPSILNEISLTNNTKNATGILEVAAPPHTNLSDLSIRTLIPISAAGNVSDISAFGMDAVVSVTGSGYEINWHLNSLAAGSTSFGYYMISGLLKQNTLRDVQNTFVQPSVLAASQVLRVVGTDVPEMYVGSTGNVKVEVLYTGSDYSPVSLTLSGPVGAVVYNESQVINATPNSDISTEFGIGPTSTGTLLMTLYISGGGQTLSEQIPVLVLPSTVAAASSSALPTTFVYAVALLAVAILVVMARTLTIRRGRRSGAQPKDLWTGRGVDDESLRNIAKQIREPDTEKSRAGSQAGGRRPSVISKFRSRKPDKTKFNRLKDISEGIEHEDGE